MDSSAGILNRFRSLAADAWMERFEPEVGKQGVLGLQLRNTAVALAKATVAGLIGWKIIQVLKPSPLIVSAIAVGANAYSSLVLAHYPVRCRSNHPLKSPHVRGFLAGAYIVWGAYGSSIFFNSLADTALLSSYLALPKVGLSALSGAFAAAQCLGFLCFLFARAPRPTADPLPKPAPIELAIKPTLLAWGEIAAGGLASFGVLRLARLSPLAAGAIVAGYELFWSVGTARQSPWQKHLHNKHLCLIAGGGVIVLGAYASQPLASLITAPRGPLLSTVAQGALAACSAMSAGVNLSAAVLFLPIRLKQSNPESTGQSSNEVRRKTGRKN